MKFTELSVKNLKPQDKKRYYWADKGSGRHGFGICVYPNGLKSWFYRYSFEGRRFSMSLGNYPTMSLAEASAKFDEQWRIRKGGKNPAEVEEQRQDERRKAPTVTELVNEYIERHAKRFKRSWEKDERILNKDIVPIWGKRKAADIVKRDVVLMLEGIIDRGSPAMANNTFQVVRKMFNFAVEKDILHYTPCAGVKLPARKNIRERYLDEEEIKAFWKNLDGCCMSDNIKRALRLVLVTAQRPGEVAGIHTREIEGHWWTIPSERAKNKRAHRVYLTDTSLELIWSLDHDGYVFPTPHKSKDKPIAENALVVAVSRNLAFETENEAGERVSVNRLGVEHFTPHDLRRTARTLLSKIGISDEVCEALQNHVKPGMSRVYNQNSYDREKQLALEALERKLNSIIGRNTGNIIPFHKAVK